MNFQSQIDEITNKFLAELKNQPFFNRTNEDRLKANGNIYFIYSDGQLKYIGQRQSKGLRTRLSNHLFGKSFRVDENNIQTGTVSKWHKVKSEIENNREITFRAIKIEPDNLRTTIELELISRIKPEWNIQGK